MPVKLKTTNNNNAIPQKEIDKPQEIVEVYNLEEDEMIDEIIETDPDEAQHHPIVDGDADEEENEWGQNLEEDN